MPLSARARSAFYPAAACTALTVGALAAARPTWILAGLVAASLVVLFTSSTGRLLFLLLGGLVVLQSESTPLKLAYSAGTAACLLIAAARVPHAMRSRPELAAFRPVLRAGGALLVLMVASFLVAKSNGISDLSWFQAAQSYLLLAVLPLVGLDVAIDGNPKRVRAVVIALLLVVPLAFMTDWLERRGIGTLPVGRFAFGSIPLCAVLLGYSLAKLSEGRRTLTWLTIATYVPVAVLLTGTRSALALLGGFAGAVGPGWKMRVPLTKTLLAAASLGLIAWNAVPKLGELLTGRSGYYFARFADLQKVLTGEVTDQSLAGRAHQTKVSIDLFQQNPLLGHGPGVRVATINTFDTPIAPLAYFGLMGVGVLMMYVAAWVITCRRLRLINGYTVELTAVRVFMAAMICYLPLSSVFDDKGLALAALIFAACLPLASRSATDSDAGSSSGSDSKTSASSAAY